MEVGSLTLGSFYHKIRDVSPSNFPWKGHLESKGS